MSTQRKWTVWVTAVMAAMAWVAGVAGNGWAQAVPAAGPSGYIVQFVNPPIALQPAKSADGKVQAKAALESEHDLFRQDVARIKHLPPPAKSGNASAGLTRFEYYTVFNGAALTMSADEAKAVAALPYVKAVHEDKAVHVNDWSLADSTAWINADDVWAMGATGAGVVVAVLDTGVDYTHPDLGGGFGLGYKVIGGHDFAYNDTDPMDDNYHGTHVAGIIAANGAIKGVAPDAQILAYKVFYASGWGRGSMVIAAIERACDPDENPATDDKADVINMSLGSEAAGLPTDPVAIASEGAAALDVVCVASSGNNYDYLTVEAPASSPQVLAVGATSPLDQVTPFSSRGPALFTDYIKPEICAPGFEIVSTTLGGGTVAASGTSMSCPHVSGAAALLRELQATWTEQEIRHALIQSAVDMGFDPMEQGAGKLDVFAAAQAEILASPNPLNLGTGFDEVWNTEETISIRNVTNHSVTYSFTLDETGIPAGVVASVTPSLTLASGTSGTIVLEVTASNAVPKKKDIPYIYYGVILGQSVAGEIRIPFGFNRVPSDAMEPNNDLEHAASITVTDIRTQVGDDGSTMLQPLMPGASDPDEDWYKFYGRAGQGFVACVQGLQIQSSLILPHVEVYGESLSEPLFAHSLDHRVNQETTRIVRLPHDGMYHLRIAPNPGMASWAQVGMYRLFVNVLPDDVVFWERLIQPRPEMELMGYYDENVLSLDFGDHGNYLHALEFSPISYWGSGMQMENFQYLYDNLGNHAYVSTSNYLPVFQSAASEGTVSAAVFAAHSGQDTWRYDGTDWSSIPASAGLGQRYAQGMAFDAARGVVVLFGGIGADELTRSDTWTWNGTTWTQATSANHPSARYHPKMAYDSHRNVVVLHGGEWAEPYLMTGGLNDTWEWNGSDWTQVATATTPTPRSQCAFAFDSNRHITVMHGGFAGSGNNGETWEYDGSDWVLRNPATSAPGGPYTRMAYDAAHGEMLLVAGMPWETWSWDGTDWAQKTSAASVDVAECEITYDNTRGKVVLVAQPGADNHALLENRTYEWNGTDWDLINTSHAMSKRVDMGLTYDAVRQQTVCYGGFLYKGAYYGGALEPSSQQFTIRNAPSSTAVYTEWLEYPDNLNGLAVSASGSRIVTSNNRGQLIVRDGTGAILDTFTPPLPVILQSLSADGSVAIIQSGGSWVPFDLNTGAARSGPATSMRVSSDGSRIVAIQGLDIEGYLWNGSAYDEVWQFTSPDMDAQQVMELALAGNGSLAVAAYRHYLGPGNPRGYTGTTYHFLDGLTGSLLYSYRKDLDPLVQQGQGFSHWHAKVNEDGTLASVSDWSMDYRHPEVLVFTPSFSQPIFRLDLPGAVKAMDLTGNLLAVGTGDIEYAPEADVVMADLTDRLTDYDGDGIPNATEGSGDTDGDGLSDLIDPDSDNDGLPDAWEYEYGLDQTDDGSGDPSNGPSGDPDGDGLTNLEELQGGSDPLVVTIPPGDSDGDGISNAEEGVADPDGDGLPNYLDTDSDEDGVSDTVERMFGTDPYDAINPTELPVTWWPVAVMLLLAGGFAMRRFAMFRNKK